MTLPISKTYRRLTKALLNKEPEEGQTALGPALIIAKIMLSNSSKGSQIVTITDGGANYGIGDLERPIPVIDLREKKKSVNFGYNDKEERSDDDKNKMFYAERADEFFKSGIIASFFTLGEVECYLKDLSIITTKTQGLMGRTIIPIEIPNITLPLQLKQITNISIKLISDRRLRIISINDTPSDEAQYHSLTYKRDYIFLNTIFYFEFFMVPKQEFNFSDHFPIQVQIQYSKRNDENKKVGEKSA